MRNPEEGLISSVRNAGGGGRHVLIPAGEHYGIEAQSLDLINAVSWCKRGQIWHLAAWERARVHTSLGRGCVCEAQDTNWRDLDDNTRRLSKYLLNQAGPRDTSPYRWSRWWPPRTGAAAGAEPWPEPSQPGSPLGFEL